MRARGDLETARLGQGTRLASNAVINASGSIAFYAAIVIVTPLAISGLGDRLWGVWQLVGAATSYALLIGLGLEGAVSYYVAKSIADDDTTSLRSAIHNARLYFMIAGTFIALFFLVAGWSLVEYLVGGDDIAIAYKALALSAVLTGLTMPTRIFTSVLSGMQRFSLITTGRLVSGLMLVVGCFFGFKTGSMGLLSFATLMTIAPIVPGAIAWFAARRILPRDTLRWQGFRFDFLKEMFAYSINTVLYTAGSVILFQSMKVMAAWKLGGPIAAGHIGLVVSLAQILSVLFVPLVGVIHPRVRDLASRGRAEELPGLLLRTLTATGFLVMPLVIFTTIETRLIFEAWVGDAVSPETIIDLSRTVKWMMLGQGPFILFLPCFYALLGLGEHRIFGFGMIGAGVANLGLSSVAISFYPHLESLGLAFGLALAAMVFLVTVPVTLGRFQIRYWAGMRAALLLPAAATIPGLLAFVIQPDIENPKIELVVVGILFGALILPGLWAARRIIFGERP